MRINWIIIFSTKKMLKTRASGGVIKCRPILSDILKWVGTHFNRVPILTFEVFSQIFQVYREGSLAYKIYEKYKTCVMF